jgi:DNA-binding NtrC family response regulator
MDEPKRILLVDDDPMHLEIYGMIVDRAGYQGVPLLVRFSGADPFPDGAVSAILLDYRLNSVKSPPEIAKELLARFPGVPIIVLSDLWGLPPDIAPYAAGFVRKGEPKNLLKTLNSLFAAG